MANDYKKVLGKFDSMRKSEKTRKKFKRVRCPHCGAISKVLKEINGSFQYRVCRNDHEFTYSYKIETYRQS